MNFLQRTPFFRLFIALVAGIVYFRYFEISITVLFVLLFVSVFIVVASYFFKKTENQFRFRWLFGWGVFMFLFVLGYSICFYYDSSATFYPLNQKRTFIVTTKFATQEKPKSYRCEVVLSKVLINNTWEKAQGNAVIYFEKNDNAKHLLINDKLIIRTTFKSPPGKENPGGFDYAAYLKQNGIRATAYVNATDWYKTNDKTQFLIIRKANIARAFLLSIYEKYGIKDYEYAVLAALTVGYTDDLSPDLRASYSATGAMHILSVSGLHVGIVYVVIAFLLSFLKRNRFQLVFRALLIVLFLWSYAFVTGLSPSVIRSAFMFSFVAIGTSLERKSQIYNTVFMSAFIMLLIEPNYLYNIGFQLSYAAVLSIVIFQKPFASLLPVRSKIAGWCRDLLTVSIAAQIGTLPFTLFYFQQFPNYFLLTNLIAIPLSSIIIYLAMALLAISNIPIVASAVAFILKWALWALNFSIVSIYELPYSTSIFTLDFLQMLLFVIAITCTTMYFYTKNATSLILSLLATLFIFIISFLVIYNTSQSDKIIVYASQKHTHINFIEKGENYIYTDNEAELKKIALLYWRQNKIGVAKSINKTNNFRNNYVIFASKKIAIAKKEFWSKKTLTSPLSVDLLIIGNKLKPKAKYLFENIKPKLVIVDKTISAWYTESIRKKCAEKSIAFYSIADNGAYVYSKND
ncbi:MAG: ComEC/Rec2 family competence protein [Paludibacter sp.]